MYVDTATYTRDGKKHKRYLLRKSYRENGKVKKKTIASLCRLTEDEIDAIKIAFKHKSKLESLHSIKDVKLLQGKSYGAVLLLKKIAMELGITKALGNTDMGKLALWQVLGRVLFQGSRISLIRSLDNHLAKEVLSLKRVTEKTLYRNLSWVESNQQKIEKKLFAQSKLGTSLYLYDVTSSYFEGEHNELSSYGYNRDKKKGKKQIVIGLLTNSEGYPVATRVFSGNTSDSKTVSEQVQLLQKKFDVKKVTLVGDKAMFSQKQIEDLPEEFSYITSIGKPQIKKLIKENHLQLSLFDENVKEVETEDKRYIFRCNPIRKEEMHNTRNAKIKSVKALLNKKNKYLAEHTRAKPEIAIRDLSVYAKKLKIDKLITINHTNRTIEIKQDEKAIENVSQFDGCYCIATNLTQDEAQKDTIHNRYKDLSLVESAFRTMKQTHLEIRPVFLRREDRTRGHVFITALSFMIQRKLSEYWKDLKIPVTEGLKSLTILTTSIIKFAKGEIHTFNQPNKICAKLLNAAKVEIPKRVPT